MLNLVFQRARAAAGAELDQPNLPKILILLFIRATLNMKKLSDSNRAQ